MKQRYIFLVLLFASGGLLAQRLPGGATTQAAGGGGGTQPPAGYSCFEPLSAYQLSADSTLVALDKTQVPTGTPVTCRAV